VHPFSVTQIKHKIPPSYSRADDNARSLYGLSG
jgi:hypothetical protein